MWVHACELVCMWMNVGEDVCIYMWVNMHVYVWETIQHTFSLYWSALPHSSMTDDDCFSSCLIHCSPLGVNAVTWFHFQPWRNLNSQRHRTFLQNLEYDCNFTFEGPTSQRNSQWLMLPSATQRHVLIHQPGSYRNCSPSGPVLTHLTCSPVGREVIGNPEQQQGTDRGTEKKEGLSSPSSPRAAAMGGGETAVWQGHGPDWLSWVHVLSWFPYRCHWWRHTAQHVPSSFERNRCCLCPLGVNVTYATKLTHYALCLFREQSTPIPAGWGGRDWFVKQGYD